MENRRREERAAARSARQQPPAGASTSSAMSPSQKNMLEQFMRTDEYKALAPNVVEEVNLASDEEGGEHDKDYVPESGKKKRR